MKRVGLLGGTFNPPHIGHLIIAREVKWALKLDEVRLMPTFVPPHKNSPTTATPHQRLEMTKLAIRHVEGISVSSFEVESGGVSYTFETMQKLKEKEPNVSFYFIIGGDMIDSLSSWYRIQELQQLVQFIGVKRPGTKGDTDIPIQIVDIPQIELSSTFIRQRFKEKGPVEHLIPKEVENYIREVGLYDA